MKIKRLRKHNPYIKALLKQDRIYLLSLLWWKSYNHFIFDYFVHYSHSHPLDFYTYVQKYILLKEKLSSSLFSIVWERVKTSSNKSILFKRYLWYIFEWHIFFSTNLTKIQVSKSKWVPVDEFKENFESLLNIGLYDNIFWKDIYLPSTSSEIENNVWVRDNFYNHLYSSLYHQETTHEPLFMRIVSIFSILSTNFKDVDILKKYIMILFALIHYTHTTDSKYFFNIDEFLSIWLKNTSINKSEVLVFLEFIGIDTYENYIKRVKNRVLRDYFPKKQSYNFINMELEIHKTPFIDISTSLRKDWFYFFDETYLLKTLYTKLWEFSIDDSWKDWDFWHLIEKYMYTFIEKWLWHKNSKLVTNDYIIKYWVEFSWANQWEIDLIIYNKTSKNAVIFESKDHLQLNEKLFSVWIVENLTKKEIHWRKWPWNIYKWIEQLYKHSKRNKIDIAAKLWVDEVRDIEYVFLNHHNTMLWNEIIRYFLSKRDEFLAFRYHFMSLHEFEMLIWIGCQTWVDFYDLILEKSNKFDEKKSYRIILERFKAFTENSDSIETEYEDTLNQDFKMFYHKKYDYYIANNYPFASTSFLSSLFTK